MNECENIYEHTLCPCVLNVLWTQTFIRNVKLKKFHSDIVYVQYHTIKTK